MTTANVLRGIRSQSIARKNWAAKSTTLAEAERAAMTMQAEAEIAALDVAIEAVAWEARDVQLSLTTLQAKMVMSACYRMARRAQSVKAKSNFTPLPGKFDINDSRAKSFIAIGDQLAVKLNVEPYNRAVAS